MEKPYNYDQWLAQHTNIDGTIDHLTMLEQFLSVSNQYELDRNSHAGQGIWENALLYVNYYIASISSPEITDKEFIEIFNSVS